MTTARFSTPGRICLFGEHQDYLHLPVVPCAISLRITIDASHQRDPMISIALPDLGDREEFPLAEPLAYRHKRDYLRSGVNVLRRHGFTFERGIRATVYSQIPINAGTSSSSALLVTWVALLGYLSDQARPLAPEECARYAHEAEVLEFGEPGGQMDHYSTALGGILAIDFAPALRLEQLSATPGTFVLGNSGEPKDTTEILRRVKNRVLHLSRMLEQRHTGFSLQTATESTVADLAAELSPEDTSLLAGTIRNRQLTHEARLLLGAASVDYRALGALLDEHHAVLRDRLHVSTPKIDRMLDAARAAGAYGGKINGSGGGGCMFVYAPDDPASVARAIAGAGGEAYVVTMTDGVRQETA